MYSVPGNIIFINGESKEVSTILPTDYCKYKSVYEVIRVIDTCPLFFEDHIERLQVSCLQGGYKALMHITEIREKLYSLISITGIKNGNIRVSYNYCKDEELSMIYFIESKYPDNDNYNQGVETIVYKAERETPEIKLYNQKLRLLIAKELDSVGAYEALLVDSCGNITEGSKSNAFFVKGDIIYTAPASRVLSGITRRYILDIIKKHNYQLNFDAVNIADLHTFDAVFISGTSPMVLPVSSIDAHKYSVPNSLVSLIMKEYTKQVKRYIAHHLF